MQVIPLNQAIYFNATQMSLLYVYLLAFTYHPAYPNILYLLYGQRNAMLGTYDSMHLLTRDTDTATFIQNDTLNIDFHCVIDCEIKATPSFLLIESQTVIGIYTIAQNTRKVETSVHYYLMEKTSANNGPDIITRYADIHADKFIIMDPKNSTFLLGNTTQQIPLSFPFTFNGDSVLYVGMYQSRIIVALDKAMLKFYFYPCLACPNNSPFIALTVLSVTAGFRIYRGNALANSSIVDGVVYWGFNAGQTSPMILSNDTYFFALKYYLTTSGMYSTGNRENLLFFGLDDRIYHHTFDIDDTNPSVYTYGQVVKKMAITNDSTLVAIKDSLSTWRIRQYQFVSNCTYYMASPSNNVFICDCQAYNSKRQCSIAPANQSGNSTNNTNATVISNQTNTTTNNSIPIVNPVINTTTGNQTNISTASGETTFPIGAVIGVIAGLVVITVSIIIVKKNYQRCIKGRRRTPWKYNPVELMSFQA